MDHSFKFDRTTKVGFVGVGAMGGGMAACLLSADWEVHFFARNSQSGASLSAAGATRAESVEAIGRRCTLVFLCLPDAEAVESVLFAQAGCLADTLQPGACVVDMSSTSASSAQSVARRLASRRVQFLDAPVSGGEQAAREGRLSCMVGGELTVLTACHDALDSFCEVVTHVGDVGAGQIVKGCNQVAVAGALLGVADAVALAQAQGLDPYVMRDVLLQGTACSTVLRRHAPKIIERQFAPGFRAELMRKDLRVVLRSAEKMNLNLAVTRLAEYLLDSLCSSGYNDSDWSAVALAANWTSSCPRVTEIEAHEPSACVGG